MTLESILEKYFHKKEVIPTYPETCGFYLIFNSDGYFIYVGKAKNLREEIRHHFSSNEKNILLRFNAYTSAYITTETIDDAMAGEALIFDFWFKTHGVFPQANRNRPPLSTISDEEVEEMKKKQVNDLLRKAGLL